jgi:hypothetical protein
MQRLRNKIEWLNKSLDREQQQSEPTAESAVKKAA